MGTMHGGVLCDIGDAAISTAHMSTLETDQLFTTLDLSVNFLQPVVTWAESIYEEHRPESALLDEL